MKNLKTKKAFTIIEVMLVVSISGLMLVTMLVGWNANIERQRYNDSVNTFKSDIQGVFSDVENQTTKTNESIVIQTVLILALVVIMAVLQLVRAIVLF